jgi:threonine dehydratase
MPVIAPLMKIQNCRKYGATVHIKGANLSEVSTLFSFNVVLDMCPV